MFEMYKDAIKKSFYLKGRATRKEYWNFVLINLLVLFIFSSVITIAMLVDLDSRYDESFAKGTISVFVIAYIFIIPAGVSITIRRLHDINFSGLWFFICWFPVLGTILLLVLTILPSADHFVPRSEKSLTTRISLWFFAILGVLSLMVWNAVTNSIGN